MWESSYYEDDDDYWDDYDEYYSDYSSSKKDNEPVTKLYLIF